MFNWFKKGRKNIVTPKPVTPFIGEQKDDGYNYLMQHRWGGNSTNFPLELLDEFYDELLAEDIEHVCVALEHESAWNLGAYSSGALVYENVEEGGPRHMMNVSKQDVIRLWKLLAVGDLETLEQQKWKSGYH